MTLNDGIQECLVSLNSHSAHLTTVRILLLKSKMNLSDALDRVVVSLQITAHACLTKQKIL